MAHETGATNPLVVSASNHGLALRQAQGERSCFHPHQVSRTTNSKANRRGIPPGAQLVGMMGSGTLPTRSSPIGAGGGRDW